MSFTKSTTDISVHQKLGDYPNQDNGMTADELKKKFDYPAETLQNDLNKIVEELENENATQNIGASKLDENDETENNVQAKLNKIYQTTKDVTLGQIPDGTITEEKLDGEYANSLAKKGNLGLMYLSSVYNTPNCENQEEKEYTSPSLTSSNTQGYTITATDYDLKSENLDMYTLLGGDGTKRIQRYGGNEGNILIVFPNFVKLSSFFITTSNANIKIDISQDGKIYTQIFNSNGIANGTYTLNSTTYYKYVRIVYGNWESGSALVYNNIKFYGKIIENLELPTITTPSLTSENKMGYTVNVTGSASIFEVDDIYSMLGGDGEKYLILYTGRELIIEFPNYFKMTEWKAKASKDNGFSIYASNDGINYTFIAQISRANDNSNGTKFVTLDNGSYYKYYKIAYSYGDYTTEIYNNMYFKGQIINELQGNDLSIAEQYENETLDKYIDGMIVKIKTPTNYIDGTNLYSQLKIYNLEYKKIPKDLKPNKYYTLVYKNSEFVHESEV